MPAQERHTARDPLTERVAYSVAELMRLLPLPRRAAYRLAGELGVKAGERALVPRDRVEAFLRGELKGVAQRAAPRRGSRATRIP